MTEEWNKGDYVFACWKAGQPIFKTGPSPFLAARRCIIGLLKGRAMDLSAKTGAGKAITTLAGKPIPLRRGDKRVMTDTEARADVIERRADILQHALFVSADQDTAAKIAHHMMQLFAGYSYDHTLIAMAYCLAQMTVEMDEASLDAVLLVMRRLIHTQRENEAAEEQ